MNMGQQVLGLKLKIVISIVTLFLGNLFVFSSCTRNNIDKKSEQALIFELNKKIFNSTNEIKVINEFLDDNFLSKDISLYFFKSEDYYQFVFQNVKDKVTKAYISYNNEIRTPDSFYSSYFIENYNNQNVLDYNNFISELLEKVEVEGETIEVNNKASWESDFYLIVQEKYIRKIYKLFYQGDEIESFNKMLPGFYNDKLGIIPLQEFVEVQLQNPR